MNRFFYPAPLALACGIGLAGCVTAVDDDPTAQQVEVHAILDHREVAGVGCLLANDAGRWFVVAPGRVTIVRSGKPLAVSCKREGIGSADERWDARYDRNRLIGNLLISAGLGNVVQNGYSYPATLTVSMHAPKAGESGSAETVAGTPIF
ncbi:hypothetical protein ACI48D_18870 [Massilia sp. LXY-6]|uniref:hypothetical protein n=1 Tax=Massilia sp. LXY-6 TaxID=3379823 RepID=UPI003EE35781